MYDANGRCVQIAENGSTPSYSGNAIKNFLWCGAERCEERDSSNAVVSVFSGLGQKTSGTNEFYSFDHLGSIREVTNGSGTVLGAFDFDPYGNLSVLSGSLKPDFGFTGIYQHWRTNLALTWFRQYNPDFCRWLSRDPLGESAGLNLYGYSQNNPISRTDRLGLITDEDLNNGLGRGMGPTSDDSFWTAATMLGLLGAPAILDAAGAFMIQRIAANAGAAALAAKGAAAIGSGGSCPAPLSLDRAFGFPVTGSFKVSGNIAHASIDVAVNRGMKLSISQMRAVLQSIRDQASAHGAKELYIDFKSILDPGHQRALLNPKLWQRSGVGKVETHDFGTSSEGGKNITVFFEL